MASSTDWMSSGGAYWVLAAEVIGSATFFGCWSLYLGKLTKSENDGCLLSIANVIAAFCGGGIGLFFFRYPVFVLSTLFGTLALPCVVTSFALSKMRRQT